MNNERAFLLQDTYVHSGFPISSHFPPFVSSLWDQVTAQDVSTMMRYGQKTILFLINNGGYTIEVEIHDGPYNVIHNWDYTAMVEAINHGQGMCWTAKVNEDFF